MTRTRSRYRQLPAGSIVPTGWVARQARQNLDGFLGQLPQISTEVGGEVFAAGRLGPDASECSDGAETSDNTGPGANVAGVQWWNGESEGNWLHGWAGHVRMVGSEDEHRLLDRRLTAILDAADPDGYLGMFTPAARAQGQLPGDLWTRSRLLLALADRAESGNGDKSGDRAAGTAAIDRCLDQILASYPATGSFGPGDPDTLVAGHDLQLIDVVADAVIRSPGSPRSQQLTELAHRMYADFSRAELAWPERDAQLGVLASEELFCGHGPHVVENLRIPLRLWELDPDRSQELLAAYRNGWDKLADCLGVTGACRSDESVGRPGAVPWPLPEAGYEYCATTELALTAAEHTRILGDPAGSDLVETLWLNAAQAARADACGIGYFFAENQPAAGRAQGDRWDISPTHDDAAVCCAPNAGRILPIVVDRAVYSREHGLSVQQYLPSTTETAVDDTDVRLAIATDYPFGDEVALTVTGAGPSFVLELRVPGWCSAPELSAFPGAVVSRTEGMLTVGGAWPRVAECVLRLHRTVRELRSVDGRTAVAYGPLLLSHPIEAAETRTRTYPDSALADRDLAPVDPQELFAPYLIAPVVDGVAVQQSTPGEDPWTEPGITITVPGLRANPQHASLHGAAPDPMTLVPIGSTVLRWTCFGVLDPAGRG